MTPPRNAPAATTQTPLQTLSIDRNRAAERMDLEEVKRLDIQIFFLTDLQRRASRTLLSPQLATK